MKKFKFHINPTVFLFLITAFLTGIIVEVLLMYLILLFHELGHLIVIKKYKYKIDKITLLPFGAIIECKNENKSFKEEFLLYISGVAVNFMFLVIFLINQNFCKIFYFNLTMLIFNLLPIHPLDGGKILELILSTKLRYSKVIKIQAFTSFFLVSIMLAYLTFNFVNINYILIFAYLLFENYKNIKTYKQRYNMFLLSKYLYPNDDLKDKIIEVKESVLENNLYKGKNTRVLIGNKELEEVQILQKLYKI